MGMTPEWYLEAFVEPNLFDCQEQPGDVRRAFNAAVSANSFADHYFKYQKRHSPDAVQTFAKIGQFRGYLAEESQGAFRDIQSIANVYKHLYSIDSPSYRYETVSSCGAIESLQIADDENLAEIAEDYFDTGEHEGRAAVIFTRKDGSKAEFVPKLEKVVSCFRDILYQNA